MFAKCTMTKQAKKPGTKTVWVTTETTVEEVTEQWYKNYVNAAPAFRRCGGSETLQRDYTSRGYLVTRMISTSPWKDSRRIAEFEIL